MTEIDVSKCKRYIGKDKFCRYFKSNCNDISNDRCVWKKSFKLELELQQLKAENETLNTLFKNYKKEYIGSTNKLGEMVIKNGNLYNEKEKYKHYLDEIEEIIDDVGDDNYLLIREKILDKIEQVKEGGE